MKKMIRYGLIFVMVFGMGSAAHARLMKSWNYQELTASSDLIAIGIQTKPSEMTINTIDLPLGTGLKVYETITSFVVVGVLKGQTENNVIELRHYSLPASDTIMIDGPGLVSFDPQHKYAYLLFLKKASDGLYEPMSGQTDPDQAVKKLDGLTYSEEYVDSLLKK